jgi:hypothetical protein
MLPCCRCQNHLRLVNLLSPKLEQTIPSICTIFSNVGHGWGKNLMDRETIQEQLKSLTDLNISSNKKQNDATGSK